METIIEKIIKPNDCILAFGIPTSKEVFMSDQNRTDKDFAKRYNGIWIKYYTQFVSIVEFVEEKLSKTGLSIVHDLTLSSYNSLFKDKSNIILFSHWTDDSIEFFDGMATIQSVINQIPIQYEGIVDLCVCHPTKLIKELRKARPNCLVRFIPKKATPSFWLYFYLVLFRHIENNNLTYLQALEEVIKEFTKTH